MIQVTFDTADPHAQAAFWAALLHYEVERHGAFVDQLVADGRLPESGRIVIDGQSAFREVAAARDPAGVAPRLYFQLVPEGKSAKNRVHLDLPAGSAGLEAEVERAESLGATRLWRTADRGPVSQTMADPEGNEFCIAGDA
ncbi:VOC family protein [Plantibacter sp. YIM 135347]|uniref:VOC family protein n=1 Tax=Plantibacter sp. YIM 135347 TaxID=3423919 RepID=UPI003D33F3E6